MRVIGVRRVIWVFGVLCILDFRLLFTLFLRHGGYKIGISSLSADLVSRI